MTTFNDFDLRNGPLSGQNLIEASAGTGKTFTISRLFLRLLLERHLEVDQILVVTFTEAATNELNDRIQKVLMQTRAAFRGRPTEDQFIKSYVEHFETAHRDRAEEWLEKAIQEFDEAAIFTIHKFCNRVLVESAFESGGLFDTELITEQTTLLKEIVEDFWRKNVSQQSGLFLRYALAKLSPERLFKLLGNKVGVQKVKIIPDATPKDCDTEERDFIASYGLLRKTWSTSWDSVTRMLEEHSGLSKKYDSAKIKLWRINMDAYLAPATPNPDLFNDFSMFTAKGLEKGTLKGHSPPTHSVLDICLQHHADFEELESCYAGRLIALKKGLFEYTREELRKRKQEKNIFYFDDLLGNLHTALEGNAALARTVREKYKAALIDEFQDTDRVQYDIFKTIFAHPDSTLFLIGDPKQAIYGFRGADIFAYMEAKERITARNRFTLTTNYRSEPKLISAVNAIFQDVNKEEAFLYEQVPFQAARPAERDNAAELRFRDQAVSNAPLQLWFVDPATASQTGKRLNNAETKTFIIAAVAAEIVRLLNLGRDEKAFIGENKLLEKHIAVLVRANADAGKIQAALKRLKVNSVLYSTESLFSSHEALEVERVLASIAEPRRHSLLRAAVSTELMGVTPAQLVESAETDSALEPYYKRFFSYHEIWQKHGFIRMFKAMMAEEDVVPRLMAYPDGERRITNLLHLSEILHDAAMRGRLGMSGILNWLAEQRTSIDSSIEEHQVRLESDENAVKLITMHGSKGLEFPIVFCPFTWSGSTIWGTETLEFHDPTDGLRLTVDLGSDDWTENVVFAEKEKLAENLRLFYVALTRAANRCYFVWGPLPGAKTSAPAYLMHRPEPFNLVRPVESLKRGLQQWKSDDLWQRVQELAGYSNETMEVRQLLPTEPQHDVRKADEEKRLTVRSFTTKIDASERISSYSALVTRLPHAAEIPDYDSPTLVTQAETPEAGKPGLEYENILVFPRGARTGTFMHSLLQRLDFTKRSAPACTELIKNSLAAFGFDTAWLPAVENMLENVLTTRIGFEGRQFPLAGITSDARLNELEFYFPIKETGTRTLSKIFAEHGGAGLPENLPETIDKLTLAPFKGFMKGFIDMVFEHDGRFYIIDWKSNYLGDDIRKYDTAAMSKVMVDNLYILQYHIYSVALNQYLKVRHPGYRHAEHFGGVFYIFLRGINASAGAQYGVYADKPSEEIIAALTEGLLDI